MNDREYVKLNTSIQTGSNAASIRTDEDGNKEATIELRLPDSLFTQSNGAKKVDSVRLQTSKFRLSLSETPIAQTTLDEDLSKQKSMLVSTCQLETYPYYLKADRTLGPPTTGDRTLAFPEYKSHTVTFTLLANLENGGTGISNFSPICKRTCEISNIKSLASDYFYPVFCRLLEFLNLKPLFNLVAKSNHEALNPENGKLFLKNIGTLQQMLQDGLENSVVYNSATRNLSITAYLSQNHISRYSDNGIIYFRTGIHTFELWLKGNLEPTCEDSISNTLEYAFKPSVNLSEQSLDISYDLCPFSTCSPMIWNPRYTYVNETPPQIESDPDLLLAYDQQPLPKRICRYGVTDNNSAGYNFSLQFKDNKPFNIIGNKATRDEFSFLPWVKADFISACPNTEISSEYIFSVNANPEPSEHFFWTTYKSRNNDICTNMDKYALTSMVERDGIEHYGFYLYFSYKKKMFADVTPSLRSYAHICNFYNMYITDLELNKVDIHASLTLSTASSYRQQYAFIQPVEVSEYSVSNRYYAPRSESNAYHYEYHESSTLAGELRLDTMFAEYFVGKEAMFIVENGVVFCQSLTPVGEWSSTTGVQLQYPFLRNFTSYFGITEVETLYETDDSISCRALLYTGNVSFIYVSRPITAEQVSLFLGNMDRIELRSYTTIDSMVNLSEVPVMDYSFMPNIELEDGKYFYILDGTTSTVDISSPDPLVDAKYISSTVTRTTYNQTIEQYQDFSPGPVPPDYTVGSSTFGRRWTIGGVELPEEVLEWHPELRGKAMFILRTIKHQVDGEWVPVDTNAYAIFCGQPTSGDSDFYDMQETTTIGQPSSLPSAWTEVSTDTQTSTIAADNLPEDSNIDTAYAIYHREMTSTSTERDVRKIRIYTTKYEPIHPANPPQWIYSDVVGPLVVPQFNEAVSDYNYYPAMPPEGFANTPHPSTGEVYNYQWWNLVHYYDNGTETRGAVITHEEILRAHYTTEYRYDNVVSHYTYRVDPNANTVVSYRWNNLPIVIISPIQSIVLTMQGITINNEYQPVNMTDPTGSSLVSTIPVVENFYSLASSLRDLHDELVVTKESIEDTATYTLTTTSGQERTLILSAKYITKDGSVHQLYIPPNGVFTVQLTFAVSYYYSS